ncbi:hypothetical protein Pisl_1240 [Pyrobaculum islandicum DSM 4184]|uniref:Uncharacterized protein n=1 Tax=Pyrobaculum islandicum (strain DSM 4184 / JCM 9189 / GEO3) TaxID=384616 RepID=A1RTX3_PYRIL|nr:hypothetical protein Pisl_1240 [Pyrobaculum islandicum DSM 4184]
MSPFAVRLRRQTVEWIKKRLQDGARLKLAFFSMERRKGKEPTYNKLYVALVFAREVQPAESKAIVVVDINHLDYGIVVSIVRDRMLSRRVLRLPDESTIKGVGETSRGDKPSRRTGYTTRSALVAA